MTKPSLNFVFLVPRQIGRVGGRGPVVQASGVWLAQNERLQHYRVPPQETITRPRRRLKHGSGSRCYSVQLLESHVAQSEEEEYRTRKENPRVVAFGSSSLCPVRSKVRVLQMVGTSTPFSPCPNISGRATGCARIEIKGIESICGHLVFPLGRRSPLDDTDFHLVYFPFNNTLQLH